MKYCHKCFNEWDGHSQPGARKTCQKCSADLHVCLNCNFYNTRKSNMCEVNDAEVIIDKEKANYCEDFRFADKPLPPKNIKPVNTKEAFNKLFKKKHD